MFSLRLRLDGAPVAAERRALSLSHSAWGLNREGSQNMGKINFSRNEGSKQGKTSEIEQAVSGAESLCHVTATRPYSLLCSIFLGKRDSADPLPGSRSWLRSISLPSHKALIKYMLIILADAEGRLSAALR